MKTCKNIIPLEIQGQTRQEHSGLPDCHPTNIKAFSPPSLGGPEFRLVDGEELARVAQDRLTMNLNRSVLCRLRAEGMPFVCFSRRRLRYDLAACVKWLIMRSFREGKNSQVDPYKLLERFGLCQTPDGVA